MGTGTGSRGTFPSPLHPTGTILTIKTPCGVKHSHFDPLMDEIPIGDRGSGIGSVAIPSFIQDHATSMNLNGAKLGFITSKSGVS